MDNVALIISTYDKSEDLWLPLEQSYNKFWNDISIPIYLSTNFKKFKSESFNSLQIEDEVSWSDNLIKSLNKIDQKYVLLTFDGELFVLSLLIILHLQGFLVRRLDLLLVECELFAFLKALHDKPLKTKGPSPWSYGSDIKLLL